jgi:hypothetical protein
MGRREHGEKINAHQKNTADHSYAIAVVAPFGSKEVTEDQGDVNDIGHGPTDRPSEMRMTKAYETEPDGDVSGAERAAEESDFGKAKDSAHGPWRGYQSKAGHDAESAHPFGSMRLELRDEVHALLANLPKFMKTVA